MTIAIAIGIGVTALTVLVGLLMQQKAKQNYLYKTIWKHSKSLKPKCIMRIRPFDHYYYSRHEDNLIRKSLNDGKNVLVTGTPLAGKSRAIYEALVNSEKPLDVIIPNCVDINLESFLIPVHHRGRRKRVILLDDLHRFVEKRNFEHMLMSFLEENIQVVATCRSGIEYKKTNIKLQKSNIDLESIFDKNTIQFKKLTKEEGENIANKTKIPWETVMFDGTVGSIFMYLGEMKKRFDECDAIEKTILQGIKKLFISGIYEEKHVFSLEWIKIVAKKHDLEGKIFEWNSWLGKLKDKGFIRIERKGARIEEAYLEEIIELEVGKTDSDVFEEMIAAFENVPEALEKIGDRAYNVGMINIEKEKYMKISIRASQKALKIFAVKHLPLDYVEIQNNLGNAYCTLAEVKDKDKNCEKAIEAYKKALRIFSVDRFPLNYAGTQNNLGNAYQTRAEVKDKDKNCEKAIEAYKKALRIRTVERFPLKYAGTQNNLGNAYQTRAEVKDKDKNCEKAIEAYEKALGVYPKDEFPEFHRVVMKNLRKALDVCKTLNH